MLKLVNVFYLIARRDKKIIKMNTGRIKVWCFFSFFSEVLMYFCVFSPFCWSDFFLIFFFPIPVGRQLVSAGTHAPFIF